MEISNVMANDFVKNVEAKIKEQSNSQKVGFLIGAGSSYLDGSGYPLAGELWDKVSSEIPTQERREIQEKIDSGATSMEQALDLLDTGGIKEGPHRFSVLNAIAKHFSSVDAPLKYHSLFVSLLSKRKEEIPIKIFSLNYDPLIERAAEHEHVKLFDGFYGHENAFFDGGSFQHIMIIRGRDHKGRRARGIPGSIRLIKLHGSLGWYQNEKSEVRRCAFTESIPEKTNRLMIPPQYRKARDTGRPPYSTLWSEFRGSLFHSDDKLNRLIALGYGMADEHVNAEIGNALERSNFTFLIIAKDLSDKHFEQWSTKPRVHIVTEKRCSLNGEVGEGHPSLCSFEGFIEKMKQW